jgi:hypothetical protein
LASSEKLKGCFHTVSIIAAIITQNQKGTCIRVPFIGDVAWGVCEDTVLGWVSGPSLPLPEDVEDVGVGVGFGVVGSGSLTVVKFAYMLR